MKYQQLEPNIYAIYKSAGHTPLQVLNLLRGHLKLSEKVPMTYAGRLDPMAEGLLLVLVGESVHQKDEYLKLDKWYTVTAILNVETDSGDLLGIPTRTDDTLRSSLAKDWPAETGLPTIALETVGMTKQKIDNLLKSYVGKVTLPLPLYSSPPVAGKPLFMHAKNNTLAAADTPLRTTNIYNCKLESLGSISSLELLSYSQYTIPKVHGEFRQAQILQSWQSLLEDNFKLTTITFSVHCSSGTYIRSLVKNLGQGLGTNACVYKLIRTQIGYYTI